MMPEMKTLNGYEIVDAQAREDIATALTDIETLRLGILDVHRYRKVSDGYYLTSDQSKIVLQRLYNGERFPVLLETSEGLYQMPSLIQVRNDNTIYIRLDDSHPYLPGGNGTADVLYVSHDIYIFNGTYSMTKEKKTYDIVSNSEFDALIDRVTALENAGGNT